MHVIVCKKKILCGGTMMLITNQLLMHYNTSDTHHIIYIAFIKGYIALKHLFRVVRKLELE